MLGGNDDYLVCIGKMPKMKDYYVFMKVGYVPNGATLETYSLNEAFNYNGRKVDLITIEVDDHKFYHYYTYLGKVIKEPTERAIKAWITQLKLSGIEVKDYMVDVPYAHNYQITHGDILLGDWNNREKLSCVQRFRKGSIYVEEELAYLRVRTPYVKTDKVWMYLGKQEKYYYWERMNVEEIGTEAIFSSTREYEKQLENMVLFRRNAKGYQVVRK
jgi:hypothetical protein